MKKVDILELKVREGISSGAHATTITGKAPIGILLGARSNVLMDDDGQINESAEASGLDFSGTGLKFAIASTGKIKFRAITDKEAQETFLMMCENGDTACYRACYVINAALKEIKKEKSKKII